MQGECAANPVYMVGSADEEGKCRLSCGTCLLTLPAGAWPASGSGAVRYSVCREGLGRKAPACSPSPQVLGLLCAPGPIIGIGGRAGVEGRCWLGCPCSQQVLGLR